MMKDEMPTEGLFIINPSAFILFSLPGRHELPIRPTEKRADND